MSPLLWLVLAGAAGVVALLVALPALRGYRARERRDLNEERYLAWRGRARPASSSGSMREGPTGEERQRLVIGAAFALVAVAAVVAFFVLS